MKVRAPLLLCALLACADEPKPKSAPKAATPPAEVEAPAPTAKALEKAFRGPRLTQLSGEVRSTPGLAQGERLAAGQRVELAQGASVQLALESGARVDVKGPALFAVAARSDQGIHLHHGTVKLDLPPGGADLSAGSAYVATPLCVVRLGRSASFLLRVAPSTRAQLAVVGGRVELEAATRHKAPEPRAVEAGRTLVVERSGPGPDRAGPTSFDAAERAFSYDQVEPETAPPGVPSLLSDRLMLAFVSAELEIKRQKGLDMEHQAAHKARAPNVMDIQRKIAEHAAVVYRARRELDAVLLQVESAWLSAPAGAAPDPLVAQAQALLN